MVTMRHKKGTCTDAVHILHVDEKAVGLSQFLLPHVLLEDNEVTAHFCVGILREHIVWQTDGRHEVCMAQHFLTDGGRSR